MGLVGAWVENCTFTRGNLQINVWFNLNPQFLVKLNFRIKPTKLNMKKNLSSAWPNSAKHVISSYWFCKSFYIFKFQEKSMIQWVFQLYKKMLKWKRKGAIFDGFFHTWAKVASLLLNFIKFTSIRQKILRQLLLLYVIISLVKISSR